MGRVPGVFVPGAGGGQLVLASSRGFAELTGRGWQEWGRRRQGGGGWAGLWLFAGLPRWFA